MAHYTPPKQGKLSQLIDVIVLLALTFGALYIPLYMGLAGGAKIARPEAELTWEALGTNPTQVAQYNALGIANPTDNPAIFAQFDYTINWTALIIMVVVVIGYYVMMLRLSDREYRDVIAEKFDK